jgi:DNA-binding CsgD family transcriptional regulator
MYKNDLPKAKIYQEKALEKARLIDSKELICKIYSNLGCIYQYLGDNPGALNYFLKAYNYSVQINENSKMHVILLHNIGTYYQRNNQFKLAEEYLNQSLAISSKRNYKIMEAGSIYLLSEVKKNTGQWKDAYLYYSRSREMNDSVLNFEMQRKVSDYQWEIKSQKSKFEKQLLIRQYDSQKKRNLILIIAIFSTLIITLLIMRNLKRSVRFQKMENYYLQEKIETDEKINALEKFKYQTEIESKNKELSAISFQLVTKNEILLNISDIIDKHKDDNSTNKNVYIDLKRKIKEDLNIDQGWGQFKEMFEKVHHDFFINIKAICPSLTENELRFCAFLRINLLNKEIAQMLNSSNDAIKKTRYRIRKKLNLDSKTSLEEFIRNI